MEVWTDLEGRAIRLTDDRLDHIRRHPAMIGQETRIRETLANPDVVAESRQDPSVRLYHELYEETPVSRKYVLVAVKLLGDDAFVITAFFTDQPKQGTRIWVK
jgi:hypothetical protein